MTSPLCVKRFDCEEYPDKRVCEIYSNEKGTRLLEAQFEEDWHEREHTKREGL